MQNNVVTPGEWTVVLSGPLAQKGPLLAALEHAGLDLTEPQPPAGHYPRTYNEPDPTRAWVNVRAQNVDTVVDHANRAGWQLRSHHPTPTCPVCAGTGQTNHETAGLTGCGHCHSKGVTNLAAPDPTARLVARIDDLERRLGERA